MRNGEHSCSRTDFDSLVPWARRMYAEGMSRNDVMRAIFGTDLPSESYLFQEAVARGLDLPVDMMVHPWELMCLADPSYEAYVGDTWARRQEEHAYAQDPNFLPLMKLGERDAHFGAHVIGYDIEELRKGTTTILGHKGDVPPTGAVFKTIGTSLLEVLHEWLSDHLRMTKFQFESPSNFGFGSLEPEDVEYVERMLRAIEAMQQEVAALRG